MGITSICSFLPSCARLRRRLRTWLSRPLYSISTSFEPLNQNETFVALVSHSFPAVEHSMGFPSDPASEIETSFCVMVSFEHSVASFESLMLLSPVLSFQFPLK